MTQQEFARIIESGQSVSVTPGLMAAARENAHRERSETIRAAVRWMVQETRSVFHQLTSRLRAAGAFQRESSQACMTPPVLSKPAEMDVT